MKDGSINVQNVQCLFLFFPFRFLKAAPISLSIITSKINPAKNRYFSQELVESNTELRWIWTCSQTDTSTTPNECRCFAQAAALGKMQVKKKKSHILKCPSSINNILSSLHSYSFSTDLTVLDFLQCEVCPHSQDALAVWREGNICVAARVEDALRDTLARLCVPLVHCALHPTWH